MDSGNTILRRVMAVTVNEGSSLRFGEPIHRKVHITLVVQPLP